MTRPDPYDLLDRITDCVNRAAAPVYRRYKRWVHVDDVRQEMWLWASGHQVKTVELLEASEGYLIRRLRTVGERYARREKAARSGYRPVDEWFYSTAQILELLPDALDSAAVGATNGSMEWETSIADVRGAIAKLPISDRAALHLWLDTTDGAEPSNEITRILRAIQRHLGGPRPN